MKFKGKLLCTCIIALLLFTVGSIKYMGKPYRADVLDIVLKKQLYYTSRTQQAIDSALCYYERDDSVNGDYYVSRAIIYYHISDSLLNQAIELKRKLK